MFHYCEPMKDVVAKNKEASIEVQFDIFHDEFIDAFKIYVHTIDLEKDILISIDTLDFVRFCPYCGARFMVYKAP